VKTVFNGPLAYRKHIFGGQITLATGIHISGTCIKRILPATEKNFGPLQFLLRQVSLCNNLLYVTEMYVTIKGRCYL